MKILVIGDFHGQKPKIHFKDFDAIICTGDICSDKEYRPFIKKWFRELKKDSENAKDPWELILEKFGKKGEKEMRKRSLAEGRNILKFLNSFEKPVFIVPGNWDQSYGKVKIKDENKNNYSYLKSFHYRYLGDKTNLKLIKGLKNIKDCQFKIRTFNGINIIGYGLSSGPENPASRKNSKKGNKFNKRQLKSLKNSYFNILKKLSKEYRKRNKKFPTIFLSHNVPYNTKLDIVLNKNSYAHKKHLGSNIARDFCIKYKPLLCIGGHIHERSGKTKIKNTIIINAGFGKDANVLIDIDDKKGKIRKIDFYKRGAK